MRVYTYVRVLPWDKKHKKSFIYLTNGMGWHTKYSIIAKCNAIYDANGIYSQMQQVSSIQRDFVRGWKLFVLSYF